MLRRSIGRKALMLAFCCLAALALVTTTTTIPNSAADFTGREILSVSRIAHGGVDYANMQSTVRAGGFVNAPRFGGSAPIRLAPWPSQTQDYDYQDS